MRKMAMIGVAWVLSVTLTVVVLMGAHRFSRADATASRRGCQSESFRRARAANGATVRSRGDSPSGHLLGLRRR